MRTRKIASVLTQIIALGLIGAAFFIRVPHVLGISMEPRIHSGEFVLINTLAYRFDHVRRGDVIAFVHDVSTSRTYLKRVIGLPGERISIERGVVAIDGKRLAEQYVRFNDRRTSPVTTVPPGGLYVLGDNRANSDDSRSWGVLPAQQIIGKAIVTLWPPHELAAL